jgi:ribonuclease PH
MKSPGQVQNSSMTSAHARSTIAAMDRIDGRASDQLRPVAFDLGVAPHASGSVLVSMGNTRVICGVMIQEKRTPRWMKEQGVTRGWLTANIRCCLIRRRRESRATLQRAESMVAAWRFNV